jgi:hypothetical protein
MCFGRREITNRQRKKGIKCKQLFVRKQGGLWGKGYK